MLSSKWIRGLWVRALYFKTHFFSRAFQVNSGAIVAGVEGCEECDLPLSSIIEVVAVDEVRTSFPHNGGTANEQPDASLRHSCLHSFSLIPLPPPQRLRRDHAHMTRRSPSYLSKKMEIYRTKL